MGQNRGDTNDAWILWDLNTGTTRNKTRAAHSNSVVEYNNSQKVGDEETTNDLSYLDDWPHWNTDHDSLSTHLSRIPYLLSLITNSLQLQKVELNQTSVKQEAQKCPTIKHSPRSSRSAT